MKISPEGYGQVAALCAVTTTLSAASGCISAMFIDTILNYWRNGEVVEYDLSKAMNGCLAGLVGITANCSVVAPWASVVIGLMAGMVYVVGSSMLVSLKIDDAVDAIPVHLCNGIWGCLATGLFAEPSRTLAAYGSDAHVGWFYSWGRGSGDANLLLCQISGIAFIGTWTYLVMTPFFMLLHHFDLLRIDPLEELVGLDYTHHKGGAYDYSGPLQSDIDMLNSQRKLKLGRNGDREVESLRDISILTGKIPDAENDIDGPPVH